MKCITIIKSQGKSRNLKVNRCYVFFCSAFAAAAGLNSASAYRKNDLQIAYHTIFFHTQSNPFLWRGSFKYEFYSIKSLTRRTRLLTQHNIFSVLQLVLKNTSLTHNLPEIIIYKYLKLPEINCQLRNICPNFHSLLWSCSLTHAPQIHI